MYIVYCYMNWTGGLFVYLTTPKTHLFLSPCLPLSLSLSLSFPPSLPPLSLLLPSFPPSLSLPLPSPSSFPSSLLSLSPLSLLSLPPSPPPRLTELDASHNQLSYIPSGLFKVSELSTLSLSYNLLGHLPGDPEDASAQTTSGKLVPSHNMTFPLNSWVSMTTLRPQPSQLEGPCIQCTCTFRGVTI